MAPSEHVFRVHPAIGIARLGNSEAYNIAPETMAGLPVPGSPTTGGLPIRPGTESDTITSDELRDRNGALKRIAARFRIFAYPREEAAEYPTGRGTEVRLGSRVDGKRVVDIIWTAHLANKKANFYAFNGDLGLALYEPANADRLMVRNPSQGDDLDNATRRRQLIIDPGPRAIRATDVGTVRFDRATPASFWAGGGEIRALDRYPKSFPDDSFAPLYAPTGRIETLGALETDREGRLLVLGGYGKACGRYQSDGTPYPLASGPIAPGVISDINEDGWFDDIADGPVSAVLVFDDGSVQTVHGAWVVVTPPSFAPQIANVVSLWDEVYDVFVRTLELCPQIFGHRFRDSYAPCFATDLFPLFRAVALQRWTVNLPDRAIEAHDAVGDIKAADDPGETILAGLAYIRDPNNPNQLFDGAPLMPLILGDPGKPFLAVTFTQYFFLSQWSKHRQRQGGPLPVGPGEWLDRIALAGCVGGGFGPGLELTYIVRDSGIYQADWRASGAGPFRIRGRQLDYNAAQFGVPFLTTGYVPLHPGPDGVLPAALEPGDVTKLMAVPWHGDFNACATHNTAPNPRNSTTLYWAWPAQRPVQIHTAADVHDGALGPLRYLVRGKGTYSEDPGFAGRYRYDRMIDIILNWHRIGTVIQGNAIVGDTTYSAQHYLEVASQLDEVEIVPWPMNSDAPNA